MCDTICEDRAASNILRTSSNFDIGNARRQAFHFVRCICLSEPFVLQFNSGLLKTTCRWSSRRCTRSWFRWSRRRCKHSHHWILWCSEIFLNIAAHQFNCADTGFFTILYYIFNPSRLITPAIGNSTNLNATKNFEFGAAPV